MDSYRQFVPAVGLSIERCTSAVPSDGYYYVINGGKIEGRFRTLKQAQQRYKALLAASGYRPAPVRRAKVDPAEEAVERYMDELESYWGDSHKHSRRGGKSMYRS